MTLRVITLAAACVLAAWGGAPPQEKAAAKQDAKAATKEFIGSETCAGCHEDISSAFKKNPHYILESNQKRGWATKACEGCHGPGSVHAETNLATDIRSPKQMTAAAVNDLCLNCHKNQATHAGRLQSGHARNGVACTSCHDIHKTGEESSSAAFRRASGINKKCAECHTDVWAAFQRPNHHKLPEGAMSCTSCHNPHASFLNKNLRLASGNEPGCLKCHSDKRGPFVFEHAPVRNEPCSVCHEPHGSSNPRMLTRSEMTPLCLECHSNLQSPSAAGNVGGILPAIHDLRLARFRNCTICHQKVHGSQVNRSLLR